MGCCLGSESDCGGGGGGGSLASHCLVVDPEVIRTLVTCCHRLSMLHLQVILIGDFRLSM